jgi:hypothetical protein
MVGTRENIDSLNISFPGLELNISMEKYGMFRILNEKNINFYYKVWKSEFFRVTNIRGMECYVKK